MMFLTILQYKEQKSTWYKNVFGFVIEYGHSQCELSSVVHYLYAYIIFQPT